MGRRLEDAITVLPKARQERVGMRFRQLEDEVEGLGELRRAARKVQAQIASALKIKQPSVSKTEKQTDMYFSTLKSHVEAIGGQLDLIVRLPSRGPLRIQRLGDVTDAAKTDVARGTQPTGQRRRAKAARVR